LQENNSNVSATANANLDCSAVTVFSPVYPDAFESEVDHQTLPVIVLDYRPPLPFS
jgi:hypothetical protein